MENRKKLIIAGAAALALYEGYKIYSFYNGFELNFNSLKLSFKNKGLEIRFNTVIKNNTNAEILIKSLSGSVYHSGNIIANYTAKLQKDIVIKPNAATSIPITVFSDGGNMLNMIAIAKDKNVKVTISSNISTRYRILGLIGIPFPISFNYDLNLKPYLDQVSGIYSTVIGLINLAKK